MEGRDVMFYFIDCYGRRTNNVSMDCYGRQTPHGACREIHQDY